VSGFFDNGSFGEAEGTTTGIPDNFLEVPRREGHRSKLSFVRHLGLASGVVDDNMNGQLTRKAAVAGRKKAHEQLQQRPATMGSARPTPSPDNSSGWYRSFGRLTMVQPEAVFP
jgi:hypothetical protein